MKLKMMRLLGCFLLLGGILTGCKKEPETVSLTGKTMGTVYHIKYVDRKEGTEKSEEIHEHIRQLLQDVNDKMSTYLPDSELSRFNQNTQSQVPVEISQDLATVIDQAIRLNQLTEGALDITVGPIVNLWGFGPEKQLEKAPTPQELKEKQKGVGLDKLRLTEKAGKFYLEKALPQVYVDLSSIAKGFGVDKVADYLETIGLSDYLVEIGGELRAKGKNLKGQDWQIGIEKPVLGGGELQTIISLTDYGMATSGDYRNYFEENGVRFSHEIDPKTGYPIQHKLASISVLAPTSMTADGLSTGLFVLGEEKALKIAEENQIPVYLIIKTENGFETKMSSAFKRFISQDKE